MDSRFNNPFVSEQEDPFSMPEGSDSPPFSGAGGANDGKLSNTALSPKRSRRAVQKRVVSVPIGDAEGSRLKGEGAPPSDSWAWRKYGQKPIKGSPYPRGYYRCSSSKGCPARKQVERSRVDPTMLVITYACEHNHPWPTSKNSNTNSTNSTSTAATSTNHAATAATTPATVSTDNSLPQGPAVFSNRPEIEAHDTQFADLGDESLIAGEDFTWFSDVASSSPTILESPLCGVSGNEDIDVFPMGEEDESLFADLGELPECSLVFRRVFMEQEEERRRCSIRAASWCESTG